LHFRHTFTATKSGRVAAAFSFIGYRDQSYFPAGRVSCRAHGSAHYSIDPALNTPGFLDVIAAQTGTDLARTTISINDERAPARIGSPVAPDYDAQVPFKT
jgi:hypothetical protein